MKKNSRANRDRGKKLKEEVRLELTPMIDVTFLILIFFMCTLKFKTLEGKLVSYLPTDKGLSSKKDPVEFEDAEVILLVRKAERDKPVHERVIEFRRNGSNTPFGYSRGLIIPKDNPKAARLDLDPPHTLDEISKWLKSVREKSVESKAKINADPQVAHFYVVTILNMMMEAQFTEISYSGIRNSLIEELQAGTLR